MHYSELRTPLPKPLHRSGGPCSVTDLQRPGNRIIRRPSPTTSTSPYPCAWPTPSTKRPAVPQGSGCRAPAGGCGSASAWWGPGGLAVRASQGCPWPQDTPGRPRACDGAGGALLRRPSTRAELPAAPGSGEHRLHARSLRRQRVSARPGVGIGRPSPSECTPREGPAHR